VYDVVVKKFTFAISSADEFLVSLLVETFGRRAQLPVRPVFGSLFWASSAKQKARTNLVNDSVVGVIVSDDFSDMSDGEVVSATQLIEELYGDDTDADLVQPGNVFSFFF